MISPDFFKFAINNIKTRKLRSWLTIIGIVIGVAAIVGLISIGQGLENAVVEQFHNVGTDKIMVTPKMFMGPGTGGGGFTDDDVKAIERVPELKHVLPIITGNVEVEFHNEKRYTMLFAYESEGAAEDVWADMGFKVAKGRFPKSTETRVAGLGYLAAEDMFDEEIHPKNRIYINGEKFKVVGIAKPIGNSQDDSSVFIPMDDAKEILEKENYDMIITIIKPGVDADAAADKIHRALKNARGDENFQVSTMTQILETVGNILGIISLVLVGIASISLLVGAVGIMNTMYTSVLERTREIGIMKAIGATNHHILALFLIESGVIGAVGGIIGALIGTGLAFGFGSLSGQLNLPMEFLIKVDWKLILGGILFAFFVGALSGALPARSASKLKPADALRYE